MGFRNALLSVKMIWLRLKSYLEDVYNVLKSGTAAQAIKFQVKLLDDDHDPSSPLGTAS